MPRWQGVTLQKIHVLQYSCVMGERKKQRAKQVEEKREIGESGKSDGCCHDRKSSGEKMEEKKTKYN